MRIPINGPAHNQLLPVDHGNQHHPPRRRRLATQISHSRHLLYFLHLPALYHD